MGFIPFMLCERLTDPTRLQDRRYIAEPKLDGQRAQLHIRQGRAISCYSRRGLDLLRHAGMAWLRELTWPVASVVLDVEAVAGDGHEGIQAVLVERDKPDGHMALMGVRCSGTRRPARAPRTVARSAEAPEGFLQRHCLPRVAIVPVTEDAAALYDTWVAMGGEGIVLKEQTSVYRSGLRSAAWLKLKP